MNTVDQQNINEISIYDLVQVLRKHVRLFWAIFSLVLLVGVALTFSLPAQYDYTQAIKVGHYLDMRTGNEMFVANTKSLAKKVSRLYLPMARNQYEAAHNGCSGRFEVMASAIGPGLIVLSTKGELKIKPIVENLFQNVLGHLKQVTAPSVEKRKNLFNYSLSQASEEREWLNRLSEQLLKNVSDMNTSANPEANAATLKALYTQEMTDLASKRLEMLRIAVQYKNSLETLENTRFDSDLVVSKAKTVSKPALLTLSIILAFMLSVLGALVFEGIQRLKK